MRLSFLSALPIGALMLGSACASPSSSGPGSISASSGTGARQTAVRQCFLPQEVTNFRSGPDQNLYLKVRRDRVYEVTSTGACWDLDRTISLALAPQAGSSRLCTGDWATVALPQSSSPSSCRVRIGKALTGEEFAALPSRYRP